MIDRPSFPVTLAFPPQGHFTQPHLAIPCLVSWLKAAGYDDVDQLDLSVEAYDWFLSKPVLERSRDRVRERLAIDPTNGGDALPFEHVRAFRVAAESAASADVLVDKIEDAKAVLRGPRFHDVEQYVPAVRAVYHGLRLLSAAHFPSELTPHNFTMAYANDRSEEVLAATLDREQNPFIAFYEEVVMPRLIERKPRVLGLSIVYGSQLIPALTLARMVKQALPDCHITAGGGFLAYIGQKVMSVPAMSECLDSIIFHEGEAPLAALCDALRAGATDLSEVGSLTWFDHTGETPVAVANAPMHPVKLDDAPAPDFDGLPFDRYFSPEMVLPYDINRGCYYGECTFCTLPTVIGPGYRTRSAKTIAAQIEDLSAKYGARCVNFITDCMPPGMIRDLPEALIEREVDIRWWSDARVEPKAYTPEGARMLYESGCRKLLFGFETATPRLLKMMKKGQSLRGVVDVSRNCAEAGISVTWYAMVGFPSETREEAQATLDFIIQNSDSVREVSLQTFHMDEIAATYQDPETFGIEILADPDSDLALYHDYRAKTGMTQEEAAEMFEELMVGFRENLPLFSGENIFFFMQKSHYFLHLAKGASPDAFVERCRAREERRAERGADHRLAVRDGFTAVRLPFSHAEAVRTLGHPLARAARPDFLTGRYVADAEAEASARLAPIARRERVLVYDAEGFDFVELAPDGLKVLEALKTAGSLGALLEGLDPSLHGEAVERIETFAAELHRLGVLAVPDSRRVDESVLTR